MSKKRQKVKASPSKMVVNLAEAAASIAQDILLSPVEIIGRFGNFDGR